MGEKVHMGFGHQIETFPETLQNGTKQVPGVTERQSHEHEIKTIPHVFI